MTLMPPSVVHVIAPAPAGGAESVVRALAVAARESTRVVALNQTARQGDPPHPFVERLQAAGVAAEELRCGRRRYIAEIRELASRLHKTGSGIVHTHVYHGDWVGYFAARRAKLPVVATAHGYLCRDVKERAFNAADRLLLRRFDAVIAVSQEIRHQLVGSGVRPDRVHLVQNGLPMATPIASRADARRALGLSLQDTVIGWVGRLSPEKGPDLLLRSLAETGLAAYAVLVGDGTERGSLEVLARHLGLDPGGRVIFAGFRPDAASLLPAFDVLALTSRIEGTPMVILESVAAGVPIVAFATGGIPDLLTEETAWLVPPGDTSGFGIALRQALGSPSDARRRAEAARESLSHRLNLQQWVQRVWDVYARARGPA